MKVKMAHAILPILYHHFGCVCPSYESLSLIQQVARGRAILDIGCGNGYWTYMLRRMEPASKKEKKLELVPIDDGTSEWRTMWVGDTTEADGVKWLQQHDGGKDAVLLLVYPTVGNEFTSKMIKAYRKCTTVHGIQLTNNDNQMVAQSSPRAHKTPPASRHSLRTPSPNGWHARCLAGSCCCRFLCPVLLVKTKRSSCLRRRQLHPKRTAHSYGRRRKEPHLVRARETRE